MFIKKSVIVISSAALMMSVGVSASHASEEVRKSNEVGITTLEEEKELIVFSSGSSKKINNERKTRPSKPKKQNFRCNDNIAQILYSAGFRGWPHKMAWAIVYRESKGQNLDENSRYFTGALGIFQIQSSAHRNKAWWSRSNMLSPQTQANIVYKYMTSRGTNWVAWGLNSNGTLNTTHYRGWSSWQHENWIMKPFRTGLALYPCKTLP